MDKFCPVCKRHMLRQTMTGTVQFQCPTCQNTVPGNERDVAYLQNSRTDTTIQSYDRLIRHASSDRANNKVKKTCEECGIDYMSLMHFGTDEKSIYTCICGHVIIS